MNEEPRPKRAKRQFDEAFRRQAVALVESNREPRARRSRATAAREGAHLRAATVVDRRYNR